MTLLRKCPVMFEVVHRIIRGADDLDLHFFQDALGRERGRGEFFIRLLPDFFRRGFAEQVGDAEITLQLQVRPMIQGIAQRVGNGLGPGDELVMRRGAAGAEFFRHAVAAHRAPFVVIAFQPDLKQVFELAVFRDVAWRDVTVIIEDRLGLGELMVKFARRLGGQQKIVVDEGHNYFPSSRSSRNGFEAR